MNFVYKVIDYGLTGTKIVYNELKEEFERIKKDSKNFSTRIKEIYKNVNVKEIEKSDNIDVLIKNISNNDDESIILFLLIDVLNSKKYEEYVEIYNKKHLNFNNFVNSIRTQLKLYYRSNTTFKTVDYKLRY